MGCLRSIFSLLFPFQSRVSLPGGCCAGLVGWVGLLICLRCSCVLVPLCCLFFDFERSLWLVHLPRSRRRRHSRGKEQRKYKSTKAERRLDEQTPSTSIHLHSLSRVTLKSLLAYFYLDSPSLRFTSHWPQEARDRSTDLFQLPLQPIVFYSPT